jgi:ABC-type methionine transport system ATPase subunit
LEGFRRSHLGFVFQTFNLFPTLSALDNVRLALSMRGVSLRVARARATELLTQVGLGHRSWLRPTRLSTGECQRVAIARALANAPQILMADEPTASLDAENGQAVMRLLTRLTEEQGVTVVIVTHDNRILPYAHRIFRLEDGYLTQVQEVEIVSADPDVSGFTASRIGTTAPRGAGAEALAQADHASRGSGMQIIGEADEPVVSMTHDREIFSAADLALLHELGNLHEVHEVATTPSGQEASGFFCTRIDCGSFAAMHSDLPPDVLGLSSAQVEYVTEGETGRIASETDAPRPDRNLEEPAAP